MKKAVGKLWRGSFVLGVLALISVGAHMLASGPAVAAVRPLCGPTRVWDCTLRNGTHQTVIGTVCDIQKFEKKKNATCQ